MFKRFTKGKITAIVIAVLASLAAVSLIITNIFVPVKYLSSYMVLSRDINKAGQMRVTFLDVGYGDSTVIEFPDGKNMLIDGGSLTYSNSLKLFKLLNKKGIDKIDYLVCTSVLGERCGGLSEVVRYKNTDKLYAPYCLSTYITNGYRAFSEAVYEKNIKSEICEFGVGVNNRDEGYCFYFLSPSPHIFEEGEYADLAANPSAVNCKRASAVLWLEYDGISFLFCGGGNSETFDKLSARYPDGIEFGERKINLSSCSVIKIAGNGSEDSVSAPLYALTTPETAVLSVGENGNGCPSVSALSVAQHYVGENLFRTDRDGDIVITVYDGDYSIVKEKK